MSPSSNSSSFYPIIKERWKDAVKINYESQATSLASFKVRFPSQMPPNYNLQFAVVETVPDNGKFVFLYYSKNPLTDTIRVNEFFAQKGIAVYYRKTTKELQNEQYLHQWISNYLGFLRNYGVDATEIVINGNGGIAASEKDREFQGFLIHDPSQVEFITDDAHITLQGYFPREELVNIAASIG